MDQDSGEFARLAERYSVDVDADTLAGMGASITRVAGKYDGLSRFESDAEPEATPSTSSTRDQTKTR